MVVARLFCGGGAPQTVELSASVKNVKEAVSKAAKVPENLLTVTYCGRKLSDDLVLRDHPTIRDDSVLYVMKRPRDESQLNSKLSPADVESVMTAVATCMTDPHQRSTMVKIMGNHSTLANIMSVVPGLKRDFMAQGALKDPFLLQNFLIGKNYAKTVEEHPCLYEAAQHLVALLHEEVSRQTPGTSGFLPFGMEGMDMYGDTDDSDTEDGDGGGQQQQAGPAFPQGLMNLMGGGGGQRPGGVPAAAGQITAAQLAQALAGAAGGAQLAAPAAAPSVPQPNPTQPQQPDGAQAAISRDQLNRALMQALGQAPGGGGGAQAATVPPPQQAAQNFVSEEKLAQLREMGFADDAENRRSLEATHGNVERALEWIITQRESFDVE